MNENTKIAVAAILAVLVSVSASYVLITPREGPMGPQGEQGPIGVPGPQGEPYTFNGTWERVTQWDLKYGNFDVDEEINIEEEIHVEGIWDVYWYVRRDAPLIPYPPNPWLVIKVYSNDYVIAQFGTEALWSDGDTVLLVGIGTHTIEISGCNYDEVYVSINQFVPASK